MLLGLKEMAALIAIVIIMILFFWPMTFLTL